MMRASRVFYVGMIATDVYAAATGEKTYAGAAASKMTSVAQALRGAGRKALIVSLPSVGGAAKRAFFGPLLTFTGGVAVVFLPTARSKYLRKMVAPLFLTTFLWRRTARGDVVVFYNHAIEYLPSLILMRIRGVRCIQDIEDAPRQDEGGVRGYLNRISFFITFWLTEAKKMVVADHVAQALGLGEYVVIRGVATQDRGTHPESSDEKWRALRAGRELRLHFGGTLMPDTGIDLFCEAIEVLARSQDRLSRGMCFMVTGIGDLHKVRELQCRIGHIPMLRVELLPALSKADYTALLDRCHGSFSLRRPQTDIANTTFPSKVIEITSSGLALISTRVGDVVDIFNDDTAFFLSSYGATELAEILLTMAQNPQHVERVAKQGQDLCHRVFSLRAVGEAMCRVVEP